jgi:hypothetical protein
MSVRPNQLSGSVSFPGEPLDGALGLPVSVIKERSWEALIELAVCVPILVIGLAIIYGVVTGTNRESRWPMAFIFVLLGPLAGAAGCRTASLSV